MRLRSLGAVLMGKTHTAQFAHRAPAPTRNPRNLEHTPGGSSSGSAAAVAAGMVALGVLSIWINYDADAQRQRFRATNGETTIWGKKPEAIRAPYTTADGQKRESLLLASGWWGVARHFHYVPELALAFFWTVPAGFSHFLPWFYWVFLTILLFDRAVRDDKRCAAKYGEAWDKYKERVRYRIIPYVY